MNLGIYFLVILLILSPSVYDFTALDESCTSNSCIDNESYENHYTTELEENADLHETNLEDNINNNDDTIEEQSLENDLNLESSFLFSTLHRIDPGSVGDEVEVELEPGHFYTRITKAVSPPVFVIPDFLSGEECDYIMQTAAENGLNISNLFGAEIADELKNTTLDKSEISRISEQTWLRRTELGAEFWNRLQNRVAKLTELDVDVIKSSEPMQVVSYTPGGHYHAHLDTNDYGDTLAPPCCVQTRCGDKEHTAKWAQCCRLCRFITVLYYLTDVEEGGETAFPIADMSDELVDEKFVNLGKQEWYNLSRYCHNSSLIVKPKRGMAVMWYNHFADDETDYLGKVDKRSHHGGCDLIKGNKWIANNWISGVPFEDRFKPSLWYPENV